MTKDNSAMIKSGCDVKCINLSLNGSRNICWTIIYGCWAHLEHYFGYNKNICKPNHTGQIVRERAKTAKVGTGKLKMCRKTHGDTYFFLVDTLDMTVMFLMLVFGNSQYISNNLHSYSNLKKYWNFEKFWPLSRADICIWGKKKERNMHFFHIFIITKYLLAIWKKKITNMLTIMKHTLKTKEQF